MMGHVKIYRPAKTAMQSGRAKTHMWRVRAPLCRQNNPTDLPFSTCEQAIAYAQAQGHTFIVEIPQEKRQHSVGGYEENFLCPRIRGS